MGSLDVHGSVNNLFNLAYMTEDAVLKNNLDTITISGNFII